MKTITFNTRQVEVLIEGLEVQLETLLDSVHEEDMKEYGYEQVVVLVETLFELGWVPSTTLSNKGVKLYEELKGK